MAAIAAASSRVAVRACMSSTYHGVGGLALWLHLHRPEAHMTMLAITLAAGLVAQSAASQTTPSTDKVTVTGCVERADQVTPTGSSLGTTVDSLDFVLMKAKEGSTAETAATSGSTSSEHAAPPAGPMYRLDAAV